jgi:hypothetical protein
MGSPRFHTTSIAAAKSATQVGEIVRKYGARSFSVEFDEDGEPVAVQFVMRVPEVGFVPVQMRARIDGLADRLPKIGQSRRHKEPNWTQARRVAWRQLLTLIEMQLELVENGVRDFHEMFLADVVTDDGTTLAERFSAQSLPVQPLLIGAGNDA